MAVSHRSGGGVCGLRRGRHVALRELLEPLQLTTLPQVLVALLLAHGGPLHPVQLCAPSGLGLGSGLGVRVRVRVRVGVRVRVRVRVHQRPAEP